VGVNAAQNAGILAAQIVAVGDKSVADEIIKFKEQLKDKIVKANKELKEVKFEFKTN
jgi:5-(carboxyamino)imidazole ribonucleotide mutase